MINILKLRKLEKENKQRKSPEPDLKPDDSVENNEAIPAPEEKGSIERKSSSKTKKTKSSKKKNEVPAVQSSLETVTQIDELNNNEDNPVELFRQNLLNELLNSDTLPEFSTEQSTPDIPSPLSEMPERTIENNTYEDLEIKNNDVSGSTELLTNKIPAPDSKDNNNSEPLEIVNSAIEKGKKNHDSLIHMVSFSLGRESYGVDIMRIREIIRMVDITKVPRAPEFIEGVINLRGSVIPVINLRTRIKLPWKEYDKSTRIIVMELKQAVIGFIVDEVKEVLRINDSVIAPPPLLTVGKKVEYITGVAKLENCLIILIEPERLLSNNELDKLKT